MTEKSTERVRKWRANNLEKYRESSREHSRKWRADNPEKNRVIQQKSDRKWRANNLEKKREFDRKWRADNPEKKREFDRKWKAANPEKYRETRQKSNRKWSAANPEKIRAISHRRRARKKGNGGSWTSAEWQTLKRQYRFRCIGCWKTETELKALGRTLVPDHIIPIVQGGMNIIENLQPLCHGRGGCNLKKGKRYIDFLIS
jgi:hypothetical protein